MVSFIFKSVICKLYINKTIFKLNGKSQTSALEIKLNWIDIPAAKQGQHDLGILGGCSCRSKIGQSIS